MGNCGKFLHDLGQYDYIEENDKFDGRGTGTIRYQCLEHTEILIAVRMTYSHRTRGGVGRHWGGRSGPEEFSSEHRPSNIWKDNEFTSREGRGAPCFRDPESGRTKPCQEVKNGLGAS